MREKMNNKLFLVVYEISPFNYDGENSYYTAEIWGDSPNLDKTDIETRRKFPWHKAITRCGYFNGTGYHDAFGFVGYGLCQE